MLSRTRINTVHFCRVIVNAGDEGFSVLRCVFRNVIITTISYILVQNEIVKSINSSAMSNVGVTLLKQIFQKTVS